MSRDWKDRVADILEAIAEIEAFTRGIDDVGFASDTKTLRAVELNFIVIGEAASRIPDSIKE
jgi:uncharacterized protein with HEPN domain